MPSLSKYTQWKVIGGYSLLFLLSILAAVLIYKQITKLIVNEENSDNPNRKLFIIGNTITGLYESEGLGNAFVQTGSRSYFLKYRDLIEEVESNIDSLRDLTTRLDQILRLDTIDDLLDQKIRNLQDIVRVKQSFVPDDFYNKAIASIESGSIYNCRAAVRIHIDMSGYLLILFADDEKLHGLACTVYYLIQNETTDV